MINDFLFPCISTFILICLFVDIAVSSITLKQHNIIEIETIRAKKWLDTCSSVLGENTGEILSKNRFSTTDRILFKLKHDDDELVKLCDERTAWLDQRNSMYGYTQAAVSNSNTGYFMWYFIGWDPLFGTSLSVEHAWGAYIRRSLHTTHITRTFLDGLGRLLYVLSDEILRLHSWFQVGAILCGGWLMLIACRSITPSLLNVFTKDKNKDADLSTRVRKQELYTLPPIYEYETDKQEIPVNIMDDKWNETLRDSNKRIKYMKHSNTPMPVWSRH